MKTKFKWIGIILIVFILIGGGLLYYTWDKVNETVKTMHNPLERDQSTSRQKELSARLNNHQAINLLLLGVDERPGDKGRSDTMILMSLNPKSNSIAMLSIPRDTYINIPQHGMDKINHAYAFGGVPLSIETVEVALDIPIHFYSRINMEGFKEGINAIGGVTLDNQQEFSQGKHQFKKGEIHLNGVEALDYIRMRKEDPNGDIGRNDRQRDVIVAALDEAVNFTNLTKVGTILSLLGDNVQTNLDMTNLQTLFTNYRDTRKNIKTLNLKGRGKTINNIWYYAVPDEEFNRIHLEITKHMQ